MTSSLHYSFVFDMDQKGLLSILKCKVFNLLSFYILISQIFSEDFGFRRFSSQPLIHPDPIFFFPITSPFLIIIMPITKLPVVKRKKHHLWLLDFKCQFFHEFFNKNQSESTSRGSMRSHIALDICLIEVFDHVVLHITIFRTWALQMYCETNISLKLLR